MEAGQNLASPAASDAPEAKPQGFFTRLMGVLLSPGETFAEIGRAPRVLLPILFLMLIVAASNHLLMNRLGHENMARKQLEAMERFIPPERMEQVKADVLDPNKIARSKVTGPLYGALMYVAFVLIVAGIFKLFALIMGAPCTFKSVFTATTYAFLAIALVHGIVMLISVYLKSPEEIDVFNPVASNLGALLTLTGASLPKFVTALASWIDVFGIWRISLLAIGCAAVTTKMKVGTAAIPHIIWYSVAALVGSTFASFFS